MDYGELTSGGVCARDVEDITSFNEDAALDDGAAGERAALRPPVPGIADVFSAIAVFVSAATMVDEDEGKACDKHWLRFFTAVGFDALMQEGEEEPGYE